MSGQRVAAEDRQRWSATFDDLAARFDDYFAELLVRPSWWPGFESATGQALSRLREIGLASEAAIDDAWLSAAYRALQRWQAFRGARGGVPERVFRQVVRRLGPPLRMIESSTISEVGDDEVGQLFELFTALAPLKPTRAKWVVTSKTLYHLLPELVTPMDGMVTAPFLGLRVLPEGLGSSSRTSTGISRRSRGLSVLTVSRSRLELILTSHRGIVQGPSEWVGHEPSTSQWRALSCGEPVRVRDFTAPAPNRLWLAA